MICINILKLQFFIMLLKQFFNSIYLFVFLAISIRAIVISHIYHSSLTLAYFHYLKLILEFNLITAWYRLSHLRNRLLIIFFFANLAYLIVKLGHFIIVIFIFLFVLKWLQFNNSLLQLFFIHFLILFINNNVFLSFGLGFIDLYLSVIW